MFFGILSAILQGVGMFMQAAAQKQQAEFQAAVQRNNAIIAEQNADAIQQQGKVEEEKHRERIAQSIGTGKVAMAARGLAVDAPGEVGEDLIDDLLLAGGMDILTIRHNVGIEKRRALIQKDQYTAQAQLFDLQASSINPALAGITGFVGGIRGSGLLA